MARTKQEIAAQAKATTPRRPYTHHCDTCPPPPGPDFYDELCSKCLSEVWDDWGHSVMTGEVW